MRRAAFLLSAEASVACGDVGVVWWVSVATACACVGGRRLLLASGGNGFSVRRIATAFVSVGGDGFCVRRRATALDFASDGDGFVVHQMAMA